MTLPANGKWLLRCRYANGAGELETGITCGIRRIEIRDESGTTRHASHLVFPHTGSDDAFRWSSPAIFVLDAGGYSIRLSEDEIGRNMSCFENNTRLTRFRGGGPEPYNKIEIREIELSPVSFVSPENTAAPQR